MPDISVCEIVFPIHIFANGKRKYEVFSVLAESDFDMGDRCVDLWLPQLAQMDLKKNKRNEKCVITNSVLPTVMNFNFK